ncbi:MAG: hypothetical protein AB4042_01165 [Leptolyngbyaceae cyanobacterium]
MKLSHDFSGALRTFAYFMASGTHYMIEDLDYLQLYGESPSAIEKVFAIFANVLELDEAGQVLNFAYAQQRATDYLRACCDPNYQVDPPYEEWETALYSLPPSSRPMPMTLEEWQDALEQAVLVKLVELDPNRPLKLLDVGVFPWHSSIELSAFYVGDDVGDDLGNGSDDIAEADIAGWPHYNFSHQEDGQWPEVDDLCEAMGAVYAEAGEPSAPAAATVAARYFQAAAEVMKRSAIAQALRTKQLADDFRITVLDPDDSGINYM